jgi:hypothetical protein
MRNALTVECASRRYKSVRYLSPEVDERNHLEAGLVSLQRRIIL